MKTKKPDYTAISLLSLILCLVIVLGGFILMLCGLFVSQPDKYGSDSDPVRSDVITHNGVEYKRRENIETILLLGLDKYQRATQSTVYLNDLQSDFMALVIVDHDNKSYDVLHLNRDTMTEIPKLGVAGDFTGYYTGQLALAHTYGSGGSDSCLNAVEAVSKLLGGINIDHYMSITMDAVATINDSVGGVTVELLNDFSMVDKSMTEGKEITLTGEQALAYVRVRADLEDSSNIQRMERQRQYMTALLDAMMAKNEASDGFLPQTILDVGDSMSSDLSSGNMERMLTTIGEYTLGSIETPNGEAVKGNKYMEFNVDKYHLEELVIKLFYQAN